jgi:hypothetical protein
MSSITAQFQQRVGQPLKVFLPLYEIPPLLADNDEEGNLKGIKNNNPPASAELHDDNMVNAGSMLLALPLTNESVDDDNDYDTSITACGQVATVSNAANTSATALSRSVDKSNAPPTSTTALNLLVNGSNATRTGDAMAAGANGNKENPLGNSAEGDSHIPPMQQSTLYLIFRQGNDRLRGLSATNSSGQNVTTILTGVEDGSGTALRES